jgi:hypothetical protein
VALALLLGACGSHGDGLAPPAATLELGRSLYAPGTLTLVAERKFSKLLPGPDIEHYEASGLVASAGTLYVVSDNLEMVVAVDPSLEQARLGPGLAVPSQYEGITATDDGRFYVIAESLGEDDKRASIVALDADTERLSQAFTGTAFTHANEGFEGIAWVRVAGHEYLLALCETNGCNDQHAGPGAGRIELLSLADGLWTTEAVLELPPEVAFLSYSDLALRANGDGTYGAAVVSRRSSTLWLGTLTTSPFALTGPNAFYAFPRNADGEVQYCTVEGVTFVAADTLGFVSDKSNGDAPCNAKDESIHIFEVPASVP